MIWVDPRWSACRVKVHRPVTGPQMRATGGTVIRLGKRNRDRGHPPLFIFLSAVILSAAVFPLFPNAKKYAMGVLKHSLHSCYFRYQQKTASLKEEVDFLGSRVSRRNVLDDMLNRRRRYSPSFAFVLSCLPTLFRLHVRTARDNRFPQPVSRNRIL